MKKPVVFVSLKIPKELKEKIVKIATQNKRGIYKEIEFRFQDK